MQRRDQRWLFSFLGAAALTCVVWLAAATWRDVWTYLNGSNLLQGRWARDGLWPALLLMEGEDPRRAFTDLSTACGLKLTGSTVEVFHIAQSVRSYERTERCDIRISYKQIQIVEPERTFRFELSPDFDHLRILSDRGEPGEPTEFRRVVE